MAWIGFAGQIRSRLLPRDGLFALQSGASCRYPLWKRLHAHWSLMPLRGASR